MPLLAIAFLIRLSSTARRAPRCFTSRSVRSRDQFVESCTGDTWLSVSLPAPPVGEDPTRSPGDRAKLLRRLLPGYGGPRFPAMSPIKQKLQGEQVVPVPVLALDDGCARARASSTLHRPTRVLCRPSTCRRVFRSPFRLDQSASQVALNRADAHPESLGARSIAVLQSERGLDDFFSMLCSRWIPSWMSGPRPRRPTPSAACSRR